MKISTRKSILYFLVYTLFIVLKEIILELER